MTNTITVFFRCADGTFGYSEITTHVDGVEVVDGSDESLQTALDRIALQLPQELLPIQEWRRGDKQELPTDRRYRNAWAFASQGVGANMVKAREIHRDRLRRARSAKLAQLDIEYLRADETGDAQTKQAITQQKQALRDVTKAPEIEAAQTIDELKAFWPDYLD